jgi:hypothetical protein
LSCACAPPSSPLPPLVVFPLVVIKDGVFLGLRSRASMFSAGDRGAHVAAQRSWHAA